MRRRTSFSGEMSGASDVDPGEHHRVLQLGVEPGQVEGAHRVVRRVEADPVEDETGRPRQRRQRVLDGSHAALVCHRRGASNKQRGGRLL